MVVGSSSGIFAQPAWRNASPGGSSVIVDVIFAVATGARPVARDRRSQSLGVRWGTLLVEVKLIAPRGKLAVLTPGGGGGKRSGRGGEDEAAW
jgi:hypothetical protein